MKVTVSFLEELQRFRDSEAFRKMKLPFKLIYWVGRASEKARSEIKTFYEARSAIVREHSNIDEHGNTTGWKSPDDTNKAVEKINELARTEIELGFDPIPYNLDELKVDLSLEETMIILPFISIKPKE